MNAVLPVTVGFELEFGSPNQQILSVIADAMARNNYPVTNFGRWRHTPANPSTWDLKTDSSCGYREGVGGFEVVSPVIRTYDELVHAVKVANIVTRCGGSANRRCGLHVHIGFRQFNTPEIRERLFRFLSRYEEAFYMLVPETRRNNPYCKPMNVRIIESVKAKHGRVDVGMAWQDKNTWINFATLNRIGTVEFRFMEGTLDPNLILNYVMFLVHVMDTIIAGKRVSWGRASAKSNRMLFFTMLQQLNLYGKKSKSQDEDRAKTVRKWTVKRFAAFNPNPNQPRQELTGRAEDRPALTEADIANRAQAEAVPTPAPANPGQPNGGVQ